MGGVHLCSLGCGADICEAAGWVGCICVFWGVEQTSVRLLGGWGPTVRLLGGWGACVSPGHWKKEL